MNIPRKKSQPRLIWTSGRYTPEHAPTAALFAAPVGISP